jgi:aromatic ring-opening dioxygenase LigB subunit
MFEFNLVYSRVHLDFGRMIPLIKTIVLQMILLNL